VWGGGGGGWGGGGGGGVVMCGCVCVVWTSGCVWACVCVNVYRFRNVWVFW